MPAFASPLPVIRPALPRDKAEVAEFTKFIWNGHDYVGHVFPEWLEDPRGQLLVVEYAGKCIGTGKVTYLAPSQWWLEGFRIDSKFQGQKIGSRLDAANNEWWNDHGNGVLRFMTSSKRVQVHHLSEQRGFVKVGEVYGYEARPLDEPTDAFAPINVEEAEEAAAFCLGVAPGQLMNMDWRFVVPNADSLREAVGEGHAWWWRGRSGVLSVWENREDDVSSLTIGLDACAKEERVQLLEDFRRLASARGVAVPGWMNTVNSSVIQNLEDAGYKRAWEDAGFLYERCHS